MPVHLFDVLLALVDEEELWRDVTAALRRVAHRARLLVVLLNGKVPERDLVVGAGGGEYRVLGRVPFDRGDRAAVPVKCGCWSRFWSRRTKETGFSALQMRERKWRTLAS